MGVVMSWLILFVAGFFEIVWAVGLKYTDGFTRLVPSAITLTAAAISFGLLGLAMKTLPVGTAYSVWVGIGAAGTVLMGIVLFSEPVNALRIGSVVLITLGVLGLKLS
jgi:quaternary ammonium compound-resistance protein SugE